LLQVDALVLTQNMFETSPKEQLFLA